MFVEKKQRRIYRGNVALKINKAVIQLQRIIYNYAENFWECFKINILLYIDCTNLNVLILEICLKL